MSKKFLSWHGVTASFSCSVNNSSVINNRTRKFFGFFVVFLFITTQYVFSQGLNPNIFKVVIPLEYGWIDYYDDSKGDFFCVHKFINDTKNVKGVIDGNGRTIIPTIYESILHRKGSLFLVEKGDANYTKGVINSQGKVVIPFANYSNIDITMRGEIIVRRDDDRNGMFDRFGRVIIPENDYTITKEGGFFYLLSNGKFCLLDEKYDIIVPYGKYIFNLSSAGENVISFTTDDNYKFGVFDKRGNEIVPQKYDRIFFDDGDYMIVKEKGKFGLLNRKGEVVLKSEYDAINSGNNGYFSVHKGDSVALFDFLGVEILPFVKGKISMKKWYFELETANEKNIFNYKRKAITPSEMILPPMYDEIQIENNQIMTINEKTISTFDMQGNKICSFIHNGSKAKIYKDFVAVKEGKTYNLYDYKGALLCRTNFADIKMCKNGYAIVVSNSNEPKGGVIKFGVIDNAESMKTSNNNSLSDDEERLSVVLWDNKYGIIKH